MGRHADDSRTRGVAGWLIASTIAVVVLVAATITYFVWLRTDSGSGTVTVGCTGNVQIEIAAGGSSAAIEQAAAAFNATTPQARSSCLTAHVTSIASAQVITGLIDGWAGQAAPQPAVWIADNLSDLQYVTDAAPSIVAGHSETVLASSPVVLAVSASNAARFPPGLRWRDLGTATAPNTALTLADGSQLKLALGDPRVDRATGYAVESMLAALLNTDSGQAVDQATVTAAAPQLAALAAQSAVSDSTVALLDDLATGSASFTAVPVLEATLSQFNLAAGAPLGLVHPEGPTAGDELTATGLTADWLDATELAGAAEFVGFLSSPAGADALRAAGLRVPVDPSATSASSTDTTSPPGTEAGPEPVTRLAPTSPEVLASIALALGLGPQG